jgi:hypothetical protein
MPSNVANFVNASSQSFSLVQAGGTGSFTVSAWVKTTTVATRGIFNFGGTVWQAGTPGTMYTNDGTQLTCVVGNGTAFVLVQNLADLNDGNWHNAVMTYNSSTGLLACYSDNVAGGTDTLAGTRSAVTGYYVGQGYIPIFGGGTWDDQISSVYIWSRDLITSEITDLFASGAGLFY